MRVGAGLEPVRRLVASRPGWVHCLTPVKLFCNHDCTRERCARNCGQARDATNVYLDEAQYAGLHVPRGLRSFGGQWCHPSTHTLLTPVGLPRRGSGLCADVLGMQSGSGLQTLRPALPLVTKDVRRAFRTTYGCGCQSQWDPILG